MDIAEIRKKAKAGQKSAAAPPAPSDQQFFEISTGVLPEAADIGRQPGVSTDVALASSGLDRLFAGVTAAHYSAENAYQTALSAQDARDEADFLECLAFQLGPEEYALDITCISEIIKPRECTDIPRVPEFILGLISLRGVVVPLVDLRRRFKLGEGRLGPDARIIVCREGDVTAGLLVDSITQVLRLASDLIEPPPGVLSGVDRHLINGIGRCQGRMVILLNLASVLDVRME